jgi:hypothetical protein
MSEDESLVLQAVEDYDEPTDKKDKDGNPKGTYR